MIKSSARGDNDLDLLVKRDDIDIFTSILCRLGFKKAQSPPEQQIPGITDYYGYDEEAGKLVHVHAHFNLVLGHDATKNYHLSIEKPYLESAVQKDIFKIPAPEFELIVLVIRMVIKHSTWDVIISRHGTLSIAERKEIAYLQKLAYQPKIHEILKKHLPCIDDRLFDACLRSIQPDCSFWMRVKVGKKLQKALKVYARRSQISDIWLKQWRRLFKGVRRHVFGYIARKRIASGGLMVSIAGGDGAGKTTAVDGLYEWLSKDFETIKVHMGKPPWSRITIAVRSILKIGRSLGLYPFMRAPIRYTLDNKSLVFPGYAWLIREVCTARDRYLAYANARRFIANGGLAICDRFPLTQVKLMDGPQAERMTTNYQTNFLIKFLIKLEKRYYRPITLPELLIVLKADPETAVRRKTDEDAVSVRMRSTEIWNLDWQQTPAYVIDANRSKAEIMSEIRSILWSQL